MFLGELARRSTIFLFDQQYDKVVVEEEKNELYVETIKEAEERGFRRAFRWKGAGKPGTD